MDLCQKKTVDAAITNILSKNVNISILVNNAGAVIPYAWKTEDGLDAQWQANYLSPFYFTKKLLSNIKETSKKDKFGRIVNVASSGHFMATEELMDAFIIGDINDSNSRRYDIEWFKSQQSGNVYGATKCAQILHAMKLQEILNNEDDGNGGKYGEYLWVTSVQPGYINSNFYSSNKPLMFKIGFRMFYPFQAMFGMVTPKQGAQTSIHLSLSDENVKPGGYHALCMPQKTKKAADCVIPSRKDALYQVSDKMWADQV